MAMLQLRVASISSNSACNTVCYSQSAGMPASTTTSIRLPKELSRELARKARATRRGKSWVIKEALELYLLGSAHDTLRTEARKQSLAAGKRTPTDAAWGEQGGDIDGWKA